jgi:hypothetical protein
VKNDPSCPALVKQTPNTLANIPLPLHTGADYPVLRVVASWPADPGLERSMGWKEETSKKGQSKKPKEDSNELDPDPHPAATLHLKNFEKNSRRFDANWYLGKAVETIILAKKQVNQTEVYSLRPQKKVRLLADDLIY